MNRAMLWPIPLVLSLAVGGCESRRPEVYTEETNQAQSAPDTFYKSNVDEGMGASIAILVDHSGSMDENVDGTPKWKIARDALAQMLAATDSFAVARPGFPVNVGIYRFDSEVEPLYPMARYDAARVKVALNGVADPNGRTAIGRALDFARAELYRAGTFRKYILVLTDGENTAGVEPADVAREIWRRSQGGVSMYFVAFNVAADHFRFVKEVGGEVFPANGAAALRSQLNDVYRSRILAEDTTSAEPAPAPDSAGRTDRR